MSTDGKKHCIGQISSLFMFNHLVQNYGNEMNIKTAHHT